MKLAGFSINSKGVWLNVYMLTISMVLCSLPFSVTLSKAFIFVALFIWLINPQHQIRYFTKKDLRYVAIISSGFFVLFFGLIYTDNFSIGLHIIESKLSLFILPILIIFSQIRHKQIQFIFICFSFAVIIASLYSLYSSYEVYKVFENESTFFNIEFAHSLGIHPNYFALYVSISILHLISIIQQYKGFVRILICMSIIFLFIVNVLLLSRIVLLAFSISLILVFLLFFSGRWKYIYVASFLILFALSLFAGYTYIEAFKFRVNDAFSISNYSHEPVWSSSSGIHYKSWTCALQSLKGGKFILGHGTGDELDILFECYSENGWNEMINQKLNSHNEYLSTSMRCGVLGLATLLGMLLQSLYFSIKSKSSVLFGFTLIMGLFFTTGSLGMMHGVIFFGLVNALLLKQSLIIITLNNTDQN